MFYESGIRLLYTIQNTQIFNSKILFKAILWLQKTWNIMHKSKTVFIMLSWYFCALFAVWQPLVPIHFHCIEIAAWAFLKKSCILFNKRNVEMWVNFSLQTSGELWHHWLRATYIVSLFAVLQLDWSRSFY